MLQIVDFAAGMLALAAILALAGWSSGGLVSRFRLEVGALTVLALIVRWGLAQIIVLAVLLVTLNGVPASAQTVCADRGDLVNNLTNRYGEEFAGGGLQSAQQIVEVWRSIEKGTWTILMTRSDGQSCIMASGTNWREGGTALLPDGVPG